MEEQQSPKGIDRKKIPEKDKKRFAKDNLSLT
jgi:hypothetical protein